MSLLQFIVRRLLAIPVTLLFMTAVLYGMVMIAPPEERASLYFPPRLPSYLSAERLARLTDEIIAEHHLDDPFLQQYGRWLGGLLRGDWGYSPTYNQEVLPLLQRRAVVSAELTFYAVVALVPLGLAAGVVAGWRENGVVDTLFRLLAFAGTSIPPFILGLVLLAIFYVGLYWFFPGRSSYIESSLALEGFRSYTGFLTFDGVLNGRLDVTGDALRHLALPVFTLSLPHWATLGRVTRAAIIEEKEEDYIVSATARGLTRRLIVWRHAFRNAMLPAFTSSVLSAASLVTGAFIIEIVFNIKGLSEIVTRGLTTTPDAALALGFAIYSILLVLPLMLLFDILKALVDPRLREEALQP